MADGMCDDCGLPVDPLGSVHDQRMLGPMAAPGIRGVAVCGCPSTIDRLRERIVSSGDDLAHLRRELSDIETNDDPSDRSDGSPGTAHMLGPSRRGRPLRAVVSAGVDAELRLRFQRRGLLASGLLMLLLATAALFGLVVAADTNLMFVIVGAIGAGFFSVLGVAYLRIAFGSPRVRLSGSGVDLSHPYLQQPMHLDWAEVRLVMARTGGWWVGTEPYLRTTPHVLDLTHTYTWPKPVTLLIVLASEVDLRSRLTWAWRAQGWWWYIHGDPKRVRAFVARATDPERAEVVLGPLFGRAAEGIPDDVHDWLFG